MIKPSYVVTIGLLLIALTYGALAMWMVRSPRLGTTWGNDLPHPPNTAHYWVMIYAPDGKAKYELGLRADGVVVWREIKP